MNGSVYINYGFFFTYAAIHNYVTGKHFAGWSTAAVKAAIPLKDLKFVSFKSHLYVKVIQQSDNKEWYGHTLLPKETIDNTILRMHNEGTLVSTIIRIMWHCIIWARTYLKKWRNTLNVTYIIIFEVVPKLN